MGYWFVLMFCIVLLIMMIIVTWHSLVKSNNKKEFCLSMCGISILSLIVFAFGIDIPSAIVGGKKIYVNEFPSTQTMQFYQIVGADNKIFISFENYDRDKYEKNAKYCIKYTGFTKSVLNIEKVGQ